ncbi:hypothetical protein K469DRAFT_785686 [Zopfia rhizophila CBS 207.26]|uniref:Heterokaryon incompatibility domain-containing protein n=1 Tax=Zopfia rhizophila CBS 207.26 TaxID=1314779 RepID=A0A6A6DXN6_9PEZI|nr:hypothetical protein K469DRAFT_785686 [Zopfia rhizophila CBS 207.26]
MHVAFKVSHDLERSLVKSKSVDHRYFPASIANSSSTMDTMVMFSGSQLDVFEALVSIRPRCIRVNWMSVAHDGPKNWIMGKKVMEFQESESQDTLQGTACHICKVIASITPPLSKVIFMTLLVALSSRDVFTSEYGTRSFRYATDCFLQTKISSVLYHKEFFEISLTLSSSAMCIDQGNNAEKLEQIQHVDLVYSRAQLTLITAAGGDPDTGLPGDSSRQRRPQPFTAVNNVTLLHMLPYVADEITFSGWITRTWTYQWGFCPKTDLSSLTFTENVKSRFGYQHNTRMNHLAGLFSAYYHIRWEVQDDTQFL